MGTNKKISLDIKNKVLLRIKQDGLSASEAATESGVKPRTVYAWLAKDTTKIGVSWHEHNKLKRENKRLKEIIGHLALSANGLKKI